ncbi:MAG: helix-turn-helix domain-containing protein [Patescibacteria group bacterium]
MREATERLIELGLSDKEASVYLAMLELGPTGVQDIADKAGVNRSTTYATIEALKQHGLISSVEEDKKVTYTAESPARLESILQRERLDIDAKKHRLENAMPYFMALFNAVEHKPSVRFFEGEEGISGVRDELMQSTGEFLSFTAIDEGTQRLSKIDEPQRMRMTRNLRGKAILCVKPGIDIPKFEGRHWEVRYFPYASAPFTGEINIVDDMVAAFIVKQAPMAFLVENKEMADAFRALFLSAWQAASTT